MIATKQVGWFVVGEGEWGRYEVGTFIEPMNCSEDILNYLKNHGYDLVPALVSEENFEAFASS
jgi:hypothetical protein